MTPCSIVALVLIAALIFKIYSMTRLAATPEEEPTRRCHACGYDLRGSADRCPECGILVPRDRRPLDPAKLRDDWPSAPMEPRVPGGGESLVVVWRAPHAMAAQLLVNQLAARGVPATIESKERSMQVGTYTPQGADHTVAVWSDDVERAEAILARFERG